MKLNNEELSVELDRILVQYDVQRYANQLSSEQLKMIVQNILEIEANIHVKVKSLFISKIPYQRLFSRYETNKIVYYTKDNEDIVTIRQVDEKYTFNVAIKLDIEFYNSFSHRAHNFALAAAEDYAREILSLYSRYYF